MLRPDPPIRLCTCFPVVNLHRIAQALGMSLSELFAEVESRKGRDGS